MLLGDQTGQVLVLAPGGICPRIVVSPDLCPEDLLEERRASHLRKDSVARGHLPVQESG